MFEPAAGRGAVIAEGAAREVRWAERIRSAAVPDTPDVALSVRVEEYAGAVVDRDGGDAINALVAVARDFDRFPLLAGVDPYDDTVFNERQCTRLLIELSSLAEEPLDAEIVVAVTRLRSLAALVVVDGPGQPHHRRLVFVGD